MTSTNLNIVLTNALCCASKQAAKVSKLYSIGSDCSESELNKLKIINDSINALKCYTLEETIYNTFILKLSNSEFNTVFNSISVNSPSRDYTIVINNVGGLYVDQENTESGDGINPVKDIFDIVLTQNVPQHIPDSYVSHSINTNPITGYTYYTIITTDIVDSIRYIVSSPSGIVPDVYFDKFFTLVEQTSTTNCLTENNFNIILNRLMNLCDICECQLT